MNCNSIATSSANTQFSINRRLWPWGEAAYPKLLCFTTTSKCFSHFCNYCLFFNNLVFFNSQFPSPAPLLFGLTTSYVVAWGNFCLKHWVFYTTELQSFWRNTNQCLTWALTHNFCWCYYLSELWALYQIGSDKSGGLLQWAYKGLTVLWDEGRAIGIIYMNLYPAFNTLSHTTSLSLNWRDTDLTAGCRTAVLQHPHSSITKLQSCCSFPHPATTIQAFSL